MEPSIEADVTEIGKRLMEYGLNLGASYVALLYQEEDSGSITVENGELRVFEAGKASGLGIGVLVEGALGLASSTTLNPRILRERLRYAVKMAKTAKGSIETVTLAGVQPVMVSVESPWEKSPSDVSDEEKLKLVLEANKAGVIEGIASSTTRMGWLTERRLFESSEGARVETVVHMTGLGHSAIASSEG